MIFLRNVAKLFDGKPLFRDVSISVQRGDRIGIVGPNGAGKTTLLGIMDGLVTPDEGEVSIEKKIRTGVLRQELIEGIDRPILDEVMNISDELVQIRQRLLLLEERMETLSEQSDDLESILEEHGRLQHEFETYGGYSLEAKALKVLAGLGFQSEDSRRLWSEFSGGWRMRVALAKILLAEPDLLLLDEVMAGLTPTEVAEAVELVKNIGKRGITVIMIEHVMKAIMHSCDRIIVLNYGVKIAEGTPGEIAVNKTVIEVYLGE